MSRRVRVSASPILRFYTRQAPDDRGRTLDQIRALPVRDLERVHDYIQWLFPLPEASGASPTAPVLTADDITAISIDEGLQRELVDSLAVMLAFFGFRLVHGTTRIERAPDATERRAEWLRPGNHNFLRLTRIMRSLTVLGLESYARALLGQLEQLYSEHSVVIGDLTIGYWRRAVE